MAEKKVKKRHWAFVAYPESLPENWIEMLKQSGLKVAISPLHDKDTNPTGEPKKPHYHVIVSYDGPTTFGNVESLTKRLNQPIPQPLEQVRGYYRYLTHEDNPEKAQYDKADIRTLNGFNILDFVELTKSEVTKYIREIRRFICDNDITEYAALLDILDEGVSIPPEWFEVAVTHTMLFTGYLRSRRYMVTGRE